MMLSKKFIDARAKAHLFIAVMNIGWINSDLATWIAMQVRKEVRYDQIQIDTIDLEIRKPLVANANYMVKKFLKTKATHLLMLDDDVIPDDKLLRRLIKYDKDVVGGSVLIWRKEFEGPMTCSAIKNLENPTEYTFIDTIEDNNEGLREVDFIGLGCILIKRMVLEKMEPPCFKQVFDDDGKKLVKGIDLYFCQRVKDMGFEIYADRTKVIGQLVELDLADVLNKQLRLVKKVMK